MHDRLGRLQQAGVQGDDEVDVQEHKQRGGQGADLSVDQQVARGPSRGLPVVGRDAGNAGADLVLRQPLVPPEPSQLWGVEVQPFDRLDDGDADDRVHVILRR